MHRLLVFIYAIAVLGLSSSAAGRMPPAPALQPAPEQARCEVYFAIAPLDQSVLKLLGTPLVPANPGVFVNVDFRQLRDWDFPSKVIPWKDRPSAQEIDRRRAELSKPSGSTAALGVFRSYDLQPLPQKDWTDLEKWFAKEAPKKIPGSCLDPDKANYVLSIGVISEGDVDRSLEKSAARNEYKQSGSVRQQDSAVGPSTATVASVSQNTQELSGMGTSGDSSFPGAHTCAYLYRRPPNAAQMDAPEYYYCRSGAMPQAAVSAMLKYLAGARLP